MAAVGPMRWCWCRLERACGLSEMEVGERLQNCWWMGSSSWLRGEVREGREIPGSPQSTNQAPRIAERGLPGERWSLRLELATACGGRASRSAERGKSSLLGAMTSAQAKVGEYAFTTLEPQLGVVEVGHERVRARGHPRPGAGRRQKGAGWVPSFLRQIERTAVLLFVLDGARADPAEDLAASANGNQCIWPRAKREGNDHRYQQKRSLR